MSDLGFLPDEWSKVHHAYIIYGTTSDLLWALIYKNLAFVKKANPDVYSEEYETLGIDEARALSEWAIMKPISDRKAAVITAFSFTTEAQNALLKLFEEPSANTYFFILVPSNVAILPTLASRVRIVSIKEEIEVNKKFESFLESSIPERFRIISSIIKNKDKDKARELVKFLIKKSRLNLPLAEKVLQSERYVGARGASIKIILEHLAISLPNVKL